MKLLNIEGIKVISHRQHKGFGILLQVERIGKESKVHVVKKKVIDYIKIIDTYPKIYLGEKTSYFEKSTDDNWVFWVGGDKKD